MSTIDTILADLAAIPDPRIRFQRASRFADHIEQACVHIRRGAIRELRDADLSYSQIGAEVGLSRQRIEKIVNAS